MLVTNRHSLEWVFSLGLLLHSCFQVENQDTLCVRRTLCAKSFHASPHRGTLTELLFLGIKMYILWENHRSSTSVRWPITTSIHGYDETSAFVNAFIQRSQYSRQTCYRQVICSTGERSSTRGDNGKGGEAAEAEVGTQLPATRERREDDSERRGQEAGRRSKDARRCPPVRMLTGTDTLPGAGETSSPPGEHRSAPFSQPRQRCRQTGRATEGG